MIDRHSDELAQVLFDVSISMFHGFFYDVMSACFHTSVHLLTLLVR